MLREMLGVMNHGILRYDLRQSLLPLFERNLAKIVTVSVNQIEHVKCNVHIRTPRHPSPAAADAGALLHQTERRPALLVQRDNLAVEYGCFGLHEFCQAP